MQSKDKQRAAQAKGRGTATAEEVAGTKAAQRGETVGNGTQDDLEAIAKQLGDTWSDFVQFRAFQHMADNLKAGRRGDELQEFVNSLKYGVSRAIALTQGEIGQELDPKYLLQSNSEPTTTSTECSLEVESVPAEG